jgi:ParB/Sulfiredoxin domain
MGIPKRQGEKIIARFIGREKQPVSNVQWVDRKDLRGNQYNPNHVFPPELQLLKTSILLDGWMQPIIARSDGEIVDGFHRWLISEDLEIFDMTDGTIPIVQFPRTIPIAEQMMSTIRMNRARGSHAALRMADMVVALIDQYKVPVERIMAHLMMEMEEVSRLYDHGDMRKRGASGEFNKAWRPGEKKKVGYDRMKGVT